ncbi:hypothetical protein SASPL_110118 [Salvia splendens]|uniref:Pectin acetylesterase n=1 Tax=Salvia splendens TaxID=180675 RepID=A0A8X9A3X1_SALSN|nr:hypothetical protein SASPL_110118 [Salvia splendens]
MARLLLALIFSLIAIGIVRAHRVPITILETAVAKGADGSPPAYAHSPGYGDGIDNWSVYIQALLSGGSAGGLATILHCDKFKTLFADTTRVKCLSDSGFFIHGEHFVGADWRENIFSNVISTHGLTNLLPASCTSKVNPNLCLFPEYLVQDVKTPLFLIESSFDQYQIANHVFRDVTPRWHDCTSDLTLCNSNEITTMKDFRNTFLSTFTNTVADSSSRIGYFVHTCYIHGHIFDKAFSTCSASVGHNVLDNKSIAQAVGDWYFDRSEFEHMDIFNDLPRNCSFTDWPTLLEMCMAHEKS